jgi:hypothetical protein
MPFCEPATRTLGFEDRRPSTVIDPKATVAKVGFAELRMHNRMDRWLRGAFHTYCTFVKLSSLSGNHFVPSSENSELPFAELGVFFWTNRK